MVVQSQTIDLVSGSTGICACEEGRQWEGALGVLQKTVQHRLAPDVTIWNAAIAACEKASQ